MCVWAACVQAAACARGCADGWASYDTYGHGNTHRYRQRPVSRGGSPPLRGHVPKSLCRQDGLPRWAAAVARIKTPGFRPGCSFPFTQHQMTVGNFFVPKKKMSLLFCFFVCLFVFNIRAHKCVLSPPPLSSPSSPPCNRAKTDQEISLWVRASAARNRTVDGCPPPPRGCACSVWRKGRRTHARAWSAAARPAIPSPPHALACPC